jgi:hypothetical protein
MLVFLMAGAPPPKRLHFQILSAQGHFLTREFAFEL